MRKELKVHDWVRTLVEEARMKKWEEARMKKWEEIIPVHYDIKTLSTITGEPKIKKKDFREFRKWLANADGTLDAIDRIVSEEWQYFTQRR